MDDHRNLVKPRAVTALLLAALVLLAGRSLRSEWQHVSRRGPEARVNWLRFDQETRIRRALGAEYPLYRLVARHTPAAARVAFRAPVDREHFLARLHLETLLFPRRIVPFEQLADDPGPVAFVLDLEPGRAFSGRERCVELAREPPRGEPRSILWRLRGDPP